MKISEDFLQFLEKAPTSYHAVEETKSKLLRQGFHELLEEQSWKLKKGQLYFCAKEGSLIAFQMPESNISKALVLAAHTDSPALKLKPHAEFIKEGLVMLGVEVYGGVLLNSWLNRDLGIAGKVLYTDKQDQIQEALVNLKHAPLTIPQLAIHLDRKVNEEGLVLNKQEHLSALATIHKGKSDKSNYLQELLSSTLPIKELLAHALYLYPCEKPALTGVDGEFISAYRLDNLASMHAITAAILKRRKASVDTLRLMAFWDHEEIGSQSTSGAESPFFSHVLERIVLAAGGDRESFLRMGSQSLCISADLIHAVNPNYADKHDPRHKPQLGKGIIIKTSAQKRYATDIKSTRPVINAAKKAKIPYETFVNRNDILGGTSIGPIQAALTGISTIDIGISQLSMHSARELIAAQDHIYLFNLMEALLNDT